MFLADDGVPYQPHRVGARGTEKYQEHTLHSYPRCQNYHTSPVCEGMGSAPVNMYKENNNKPLKRKC